MQNIKRIKFLKGLLNIIGSFMILLLIISVYSIIIIDKGINNFIMYLILQLIFIGGYLIAIINLKKIFDSLLEKDPFNLNNIICFKKIGYSIFIVGIIDAILNYPKPNHSNLQIMSTSYGSLKPIFFLYLSLGCLAFILGDVFRMAMEIQDENDLTI